MSNDNVPKPLPQLTFELPTADIEFLKEALLLINAPREALDVCTHKVVLHLKKNCNQLSSEEISKLAVKMLNCQLQAEGRPTFACKPEMVSLLVRIADSIYSFNLFSPSNNARSTWTPTCIKSTIT